MDVDLNTDIEPEIEDAVKNPEYSKFLAKYAINEDVEPIGVGGFSVVKEATVLATGEKVAVKIVPVCYAIDVKREAETMKKIQSPYILQMFDIFSAEKNVFMVTELALGGDLFGIVQEYGMLPESETRAITRRVLLGVQYLHARGVVHRDLKPQNILCCSEQDITQVKIGDFGLSKILSADSLLKTRCGSPHYLAPEVLTCPSYDAKVDIWSVGVIVYVMLTGVLPFYSEDIRDVIKHVMLAEYSWPDNVQVSGLAKDFVRRLVDKDPARRPTASECLQHPWVAMGTNAICIGLSNPNSTEQTSSSSSSKNKEKKSKKKKSSEKSGGDVTDDVNEEGKSEKKSKRHHSHSRHHSHRHKHKHKHGSDSGGEDNGEEGGGGGDGKTPDAEEKPKDGVEEKTEKKKKKKSDKDKEKGDGDKKKKKKYSSSKKTKEDTDASPSSPADSIPPPPLP